jgi:replicative DNA helicase
MGDYFNQEPEVAILSLLLKYPDTFLELRQLKSWMFSSSPNQSIYDLIVDMNNQGVAPEYNLLKNYAISKNKILDLGSDEYLRYLVSLSYDPEHIKEYEKLVVDSYRAKKLLEMSRTLSSSIEHKEEIDNVINNLSEGLGNLTSVSDDSITPIDDLASEVYATILKRVENPGIPGISTGYTGLDNLSGGFIPGKLWILAARPSMGKSAYMCNLALKTAKEGKSVVIFSLEMTKEEVIERMISIESGVPISDLRFGFLNSAAIEKVHTTIDFLKTLNISIESSFISGIEYIVSTCKKLKRSKGLDVVFIDYVQLLAERNSESTHELGRISRLAKLEAKLMKVTFVILSQLNRGVELREDKRPNLADLRQSGNLEEDADIVILLYRDEYYEKNSKLKGLLEVIIRKNRDGYIGTLMNEFTGETNIIKEK